MFFPKRLLSAVPTITIVAILAWVGTIPSMSWGQGSATVDAPAQAMKEIPKDVDPNSGFRLPLVKREDLDEYGKKVFDKIVGPTGRTLVGLRGPSGMRLYSPKVAEMEYEVSQYLRYHSGLSGPVRELAILITAREMDNPFEWAAHEPQGLKDGLPQPIIDVVKYRKGVEGLPETEAVVIQLGRQIFGKKKVDSDTFARALKIFGPKQLVDLVTLMGYYSSVAALLTTFDMQLDAKQKQYVLPMP
jgi:4-carboxymuconolactone decarboxylase